MKVGLVDVDGHNFPNLPLMKISAWHKLQGNDVEWANPLFGDYSIVYMAKVFTFTPDFDIYLNCNELIKGGTGYGIETELPSEIERIYPDYELYNIDDTAYGFLTRGCPRRCPFCIVTDKEGPQSCKVADLDQFWAGQSQIKLLDPNLLACRDKAELLDQLIDSGAWVDFTQGLDIRLMDSSDIDKIVKIKVKALHFAWDRPYDEKRIINNLAAFKAASRLDYRKLKVYVLTNYETDFEYDLYRVYTLRDMGYDPYVMIYDKHKLPVGHKLRKLQRWVNAKQIFRTCERFEDYKG